MKKEHLVFLFRAAKIVTNVHNDRASETVSIGFIKLFRSDVEQIKCSKYITDRIPGKSFRSGNLFHFHLIDPIYVKMT